MSGHAWKNGDWLWSDGQRYRYVGPITWLNNVVCVVDRYNSAWVKLVSQLSYLPDCDGWDWEPLKVEEGKWYRQRNGEVVGPIAPIVGKPRRDLRVWQSVVGRLERTYSASGKWQEGDAQHKWDLVCEAEPPAAVEEPSPPPSTALRFDPVFAPGQLVCRGDSEYELTAYRTPKAGEVYIDEFGEVCVATGEEPRVMVVIENLDGWVMPTDEDAKSRPMAIVWDSLEDVRYRRMLVAVDADRSHPFLTMGLEGFVVRWANCRIEPTVNKPEGRDK